MSEQKRIVTDDFPAERLPQELRTGIAASDRVRVTVENLPRDRWSDFIERLDAFRTESRRPPVSLDEAVERVRALRDEGD